ncbi:MAG: pitrilysin family protein [Dehalococcoidia bacterium]|nr:pitrilysin family protein [Dehalococcoidia bacterium]
MTQTASSNAQDTYRRTVLPNGLRILTAPMPHTHSVALTLYVGTGSRYERDEEAGVSHILEHMLFKGTEKRPTAKEIAEAVDGVGGVINGATDREYTVYYLKVARPHLDLALDLLVEFVRRPLIDAREMEKERQVVLEELAMVADSPPQIADLLLDSILWPDNPLGRDIAGTPETVGAISREAVLDYLHGQYVPNNIVLAVAGNITDEEIVEALRAALGDWQPGTPSSWVPAPSQNGVRCAVRYKATEQAHISLALPGLPLNHPDRHAISFLSVILGEGMSSRLFLELREKRGLVYDVHTYVSQFLDVGTFNIYTGVDPKNAVEALGVVLAELAQLRAQGPDSGELTKARELSKGRLLLRMEDTRAVSGWIGGQELLLGKVRGVEEAVAEMDAVTLEDLQRVSRELLDPRQTYLAVVGPYRSDKRFASLLPA